MSTNDKKLQKQLSTNMRADCQHAVYNKDYTTTEIKRETIDNAM